MRFRSTELLPLPLDEIEAALLSPASALERPAQVPSVARVTLEEQRFGPGFAERVVRAESRWTLPRVGAVAWRERIHWDLRRHCGTFEVHLLTPAAVRRRFRCAGIYRLEGRGPRTQRVVEGDVHVKLPVFGPAVEARVVAVLESQLVHEAALLGALARRGRKSLEGAAP